MKKRIILMLCFVASIVLLCSSCDSGLKIVDISIYEYPEKIAYVLGEDNELCLEGLKIRLELEGGDYSIKYWENSDDRKWFELVNPTDFSKEGIYIITIKRNDLACTFPIEIICLD